MLLIGPLGTGVGGVVGGVEDEEMKLTGLGGVNETPERDGAGDGAEAEPSSDMHEKEDAEDDGIGLTGDFGGPP